MRRLTVLGSGAAWPEAGGATSGYLLEYDGFRAVLDLGYGTLSRLLQRCPDGHLDAVFLTHEHPDHCADISGLLRLRHYRGITEELPVYGTAGTFEQIRHADPATARAANWVPHELPQYSRIGPFELESMSLPHHVPNAGIRLIAPGLVVAYTGDTGPDPALEILGAHADLYLMDATHEQPHPADGPQLVLTARQAAIWAARARAHRLLLTHFWPGTDRGRAIRQAQEHFPGDVRAATDGLVIDLDQRRYRV
ncbi:ribonuclease BN (tRNA processing enzyme) [Tamaricihabitans halophyticus]|uniref:Ribonuclease BN (tRNA processing enzyme) n=1 Tax=Tamaricihabitans halophyticus TaxID=1262583 RepID=A0A4R2QJ05_9PSEU|nr:MBL fold metallo-hydrolase [Tamaricihabitans halophyticus]TCP49343.1 ribonuclease BN (tRNA processing enzyme) [Tamaricihabitans halophyticus]